MKPTKAQIKKAKNLLNKYAPKGEELAYINSKEANLLKKMGGAGEDINGTGIKSYRRTDAYTMSGSGMGVGSSSSSSSGDNDDNFNASAAKFTPQRSPNILSRAATAIGDYIKSGGMIGMMASSIKGALDKRNPRSRINDPQGLYAEGNFKQKSRTAPTYQSDNDNRQPATNVGGKIVKLSPSSAEISQSNAADVTYDSRKTKAKGRKMTILTSAKGVRKDDELILGKKSLLGRA
jgi:hypothetical protein